MKKGIIPQVVLIIGILSVIAAGYGYFKFKNKLISQQQDSQPQLSTESTDEETNWKVYKSSFGYSIKYPTDWTTVYETHAFFNYETKSWEGADEIAFNYTDTTVSPKVGGMPYGAGLILGTPLENKENLPVNQKWYEKINPNPQIPAQLEEVKIGDFNGLKVILEGGTNNTIYFAQDQKIYRLNYYYSANPSSQSDVGYYEALFDQILSSLKFLD